MMTQLSMDQIQQFSTSLRRYVNKKQTIGQFFSCEDIKSILRTLNIKKRPAEQPVLMWQYQILPELVAGVLEESSLWIENIGAENQDKVAHPGDVKEQISRVMELEETVRELLKSDFLLGEESLKKRGRVSQFENDLDFIREVIRQLGSLKPDSGKAWCLQKLAEHIGCRRLWLPKFHQFQSEWWRTIEVTEKFIYYFNELKKLTQLSDAFGQKKWLEDKIAVEKGNIIKQCNVLWRACGDRQDAVIMTLKRNSGALDDMMAYCVIETPGVILDRIGVTNKYRLFRQHKKRLQRVYDFLQGQGWRIISGEQYDAMDSVAIEETQKSNMVVVDVSAKQEASHTFIQAMPFPKTLEQHNQYNLYSGNRHIIEVMLLPFERLVPVLGFDLYRSVTEMVPQFFINLDARETSVLQSLILMHGLYKMVGAQGLDSDVLNELKLFVAHVTSEVPNEYRSYPLRLALEFVEAMRQRQAGPETHLSNEWRKWIGSKLMPDLQQLPEYKSNSVFKKELDRIREKFSTEALEAVSQINQQYGGHHPEQAIDLIAMYLPFVMTVQDLGSIAESLICHILNSKPSFSVWNPLSVVSLFQTQKSVSIVDTATMLGQQAQTIVSVELDPEKKQGIETELQNSENSTFWSRIQSIFSKKPQLFSQFKQAFDAQISSSAELHPVNLP